MNNKSRQNTIAAALAATAAACLPLSATLLVYEPFDYGADWLDGKGGALGTTGVWESNDTGEGQGWRVHPEGQLTGIAINPGFDPMNPDAPGILNSFDGLVNNLPTSGGFAGQTGPETRSTPQPFGFDGGTGNLDAFIALDPAVTASFQSNTTTWFSYVGAHSWDRNQGSPMLVFCTDPMQNGQRGVTMLNSGSGIGATGGPPRFNLFDVHPLYYSGGKKHQSPGGYLGGVLGGHDGFVTGFCSTSTCDGVLPNSHVMAWERSNAFHPTFGAPNIVVGKIEWDADTGGEDIITAVRFLESEEITETAFDAKVAAQPPLSSANWPSNKPDLDQSQFDTLNITSLKFFVDEIRVATTFEEIVTGGVAPPRPFALNVTSNGGNLEFEWPSKPDRFYRIYHSTDLSVPRANWTLDPANDFIAATPDSNTLSIPLPGVTTFYYLEEFVPPPLLEAGFEGSDDGFTVKAGGTGSLWERGTPDSSGLGGVVDAGAGSPASAECWGTNLGDASGTSGDDGRYLIPTDTCLVSPDIDLTNVAGAELSFAQAIDIEGADVAVLNVYNANTDALLTSFPFTDSDTGSADWQDVGPLSLPVGTPIYLEWCLQGGTNEYLGWYIDNVLIERATP